MIIKESVKNILDWGAIYGFVMLIVFIKGMNIGIVDGYVNSTLTELLIIGVLFWFLGSIFTLIYWYQYKLTMTYSETNRRMMNVILVVTILISTSEILDVYWIAVHERSPFYSHIVSGLFFTPLFIVILLLIQKVILYIKGGQKTINNNQIHTNRIEEKNKFKLKEVDQEGWDRVGNREGLYCYYCTKKLHNESWKNRENYYCDECHKKLINIDS